MKRTFSDIATAIDQLSGRPVAFAAAVSIIAVWAITGPLFRFSDTWQLIINTGTTIITFLMVFVIQNTQNRDGAAIQAKLDELIRVSAARNVLIGIETLTQDEIEEIRAKCAAKAGRVRNGVAKEVTRKPSQPRARPRPISDHSASRPELMRKIGNAGARWRVCSASIRFSYAGPIIIFAAPAGRRQCERSSRRAGRGARQSGAPALARSPPARGRCVARSP
jgi:low affinity Fe/Cu permease